jgi:hypothetical protein
MPPPSLLLALLPLTVLLVLGSHGNQHCLRHSE